MWLVKALRKPGRLCLHILSISGMAVLFGCEVDLFNNLAKAARNVIQRRNTTDAPIPQSGTDLVKPFST